MIKKDEMYIELIKPFLTGDEIRRYGFPSVQFYIIFIKKGWTNENSLNVSDKWEWFKNKCPAIASHLEKFSKTAEKRWDKGDYWWELRSCDYYDEFFKLKIIFPDIAKESRMIYDLRGLFVGNTAYIIPTNDLYLLGILNSKMIFFYYQIHIFLSKFYLRLTD